jgi:hypothetical protein
VAPGHSPFKQIEYETRLARTNKYRSNVAMKKTSLLPAAVLLWSISVAALAQSSGGQAVPTPAGTHVLPNKPSAMASPMAIGKGNVSGPPSLPMAGGQRGHAPVSMPRPKPS